MHRRSAALVVGASLVLALVATTGAAAAAPPVAAADFPAKDSRYHTYAEMVAVLQDTQAAHPDIVQLFSIGKSYQGREHVGGQGLRQRRDRRDRSPRSCSIRSTTPASTSRSSSRSRSCAG